jgi:hypothetical protein
MTRLWLLTLFSVSFLCACLVLGAGTDDRTAAENKPVKDRKLASTSRPQGTRPAKTRTSSAGYPYLRPEERTLKAREALDPATGDMARFYAVWGLAISGYTREGAEALAIVATGRKYDDTLRGYAAMGLQNFSSSMPPEVRQPIQKQLRKAVEAEMERCPDGVIRALIAWGDADYIREVLGDKLRGSRMEIEVLERASARKQAVDRLWEMRQTLPKPNSDSEWFLLFRIGGALIKQEDKRGIDILLECLTTREPSLAGAQSPTAKTLNEESFRQSLCNTYAWLARATGQDFGYVSNRWTPELPPAIDKMVAWWNDHRETFEFSAKPSPPTTAPSSEAIK